MNKLLIAAVLISVVLALMAIVKNSVVKRRLRFTLWTTMVFVALHLIGVYVPAVDQFDSETFALERLTLALAIISGGVGLLNPWFREGLRDGLPAILQDTIVLVLFALVATLKFHDRLALTSAVGAAVVGFALQDTLGNAISGLAIQIDRPYRVGHWITVGAFEGLVAEITWRATKLRTKSGNLVIVPNNIISKEAINNYSVPEVPTRLQVEVGASYSTPPNVTKDAIFAAMQQASRVLKTPAPDVLLSDFGDSALIYRARFWVNDFSADDRVKDEVRSFIYYEFRRRNIEIPFPMRINYQREAAGVGVTPDRVDRLTGLVAAVPVFAGLPAEAHRALAESASSHDYAAGEAVVRQSDPAGSMFLVEQGRLNVTVLDGHQVASIGPGGYFGEMSLLAGAPRNATVTAATDCALIEVKPDAFRAFIQAHPEALEMIAVAAAKREAELNSARESAPVAVESPTTFLQRMRGFLGL
jgi:small-conductance mechanosensitive channel